MGRRTVARRAAIVLATIMLAIGATMSVSLPAQAAVPTATTFSGQAQVGPLFLNGTNHSHTCVATVISSSTRDVIMTAAHCITGNGKGVVFVPGYRGGVAPYGAWTVTKAYVDSRWKASRDARYDYALLVVAARNGRHIQNVTGGYALGLAQPTGTVTTVASYRAGLNDWPVHCTTRISYSSGYPTFTCQGYPDGTSGSPFLVGSYITGVIGGLHQGGCVTWVSYSSPVSAAINTLYARAVAGAAPSWVPAAGSDGC